MLRSICFGMSAFLLLSTINMQKAESQFAAATKVVRAMTALRTGAATVRTVRGAQAIANFTVRSRAFPELRTLLIGNNVVVAPGASLATIFNLIESHQGDVTLMEQVAPIMDMFNVEFDSAFQRDLAAARSTTIGSSEGTGFSENDYAFETFEQPASIVAQDQLAIYPSSVAAQVATENANYKNVITAVRDALVTRASSFGLPQLSGLADRLSAHLTALVDNQHVNLLGSRAEECISDWEAPYNTAVRNMVNIMLAVRNNTGTYASAADQMLKSMHGLFGGVLAELQGRLGVLTSNRCKIYDRRLAVSA